MKKAKLEKSPGATVKKKPGPKKVDKSFDETKKLQLSESDKGSWYNQSDFLLTASAVEKFKDEKSDSRESNINSGSEIEDAGDNPATFAVVDRLRVSSEPQHAALCTDSGEKCVSHVNSAGAASICRFLLCFGLAGGFLAPDLTFPITKSLYNIIVTLNAYRTP